MSKTMGSIKAVRGRLGVAKKPNTKRAAESPSVAVGMSDHFERTETRYGLCSTRRFYSSGDLWAKCLRGQGLINGIFGSWESFRNPNDQIAGVRIIPWD